MDGDGSVSVRNIAKQKTDCIAAINLQTDYGVVEMDDFFLFGYSLIQSAI